MRSIRWRLMLTYCAVTLLSTTALSAVLLRAVERSYVDERLQVLKAHATLIKSNLSAAAGLGSPDVEFACLCRRLSQCLRTRVVLTALDGRRIVDTAQEATGLVSAQQPCAPARFQCRACHSTAHGPSRLHITVPVEVGDEAYLLTVSSPSTGLEQIMARIHAATAMALLVALGLVGLISLSLSSGITAPLVRMSRMARRMAEGDLDQQVGVAGNDEVADLAASFNDMAERIRQAMNALAEEKGKLETVLAQMADGIIVTDTRGRIGVVNPACERLLGIPGGSMLGQQVYGPTFNPDLHRAVTRALAGETVEEEVRLHPPQPMVLGVHASPFRDAEGLPQGAIVLVQDRTEMRRAVELQREFIANASHELRTPVASLQATVDTLIDGAKDDPGARDRFLETLSRETARLSSLLTNLLDLSRLEATGPVKKRLVDLAGAWQDVLALASPLLAVRELDIQADIPEGLAVPADYTQLIQVLANLLDNAIKYTPDGGEIRVSAFQDGEHVCIRVSDTGVGIPEADQARLFERFYRVDKARSRAQGGTGLGLAIAREAVEAHGGTITVESAPGMGSAFLVTLPATLSDEPAPA